MMASPCVKLFGDSGIQNRNLLQLLCTYCTIQKLHEINKFRETWKKVNKAPYGDIFQEPVHARWEHVSLECSQFLDRKEGFCNIALDATKSEK